MINIKDLGANGNGSFNNTRIIQNAIDQCSATGGGTIYFPAGTYMTGTIHLRNNICLNIAPGAVIMGSPDRNDYNSDDFCPQNRVFASEQVSGAHLLVALEINGVSICGGGRIDGNRAAFYDKLLPGGNAWRPGQMLFFCECSNITIENIELYNAPYWTCFLHGCEDVAINGLKIWNAQSTPNGDGLDIDCCRRLVVTNCIIDSGDDCITLRGNSIPLKNPKPCEHITISNCILRTRCNAFRVGVGNGVIRNCVISNCIIHDTRTGICIISRYSPTSSGVKIENISFANIIMETVRPLFIAADVHGSQPESSKLINNLNFNHLRGSGSRSSLVEGNSDCRVQSLSFSDIIFEYSGGKDIQYGEGLIYGEFGVPAAPAAFHVRNVIGLEFNRVKINWKTSDPSWKYGIWVENAINIRMSECLWGKEIRIDKNEVGE